MSITVRGSKELGYIYRANNKGVGVEGGVGMGVVGGGGRW